MKNTLLLAVMLFGHFPGVSQYRTHPSASLENNLEALSVQSKELAFTKLAITPQFVQYSTTVLTNGNGYWKGLGITSTSSNGLFSTKYLYDVQGNLRETKTFLHIKSKGVKTNWSIQYLNTGDNRYRRSGPLFVHTF